MVEIYRIKVVEKEGTDLTEEQLHEICEEIDSLLDEFKGKLPHNDKIELL